MIHSTNVRFKLIAWTHEIRRYQKLQVSDQLIRLECRVSPQSDLILDADRKLSDVTVEVSVIPGDVPPADREKTGLPEDSIGGLWWIADSSLVHGWFYLQGDQFKELWDAAIKSIARWPLRYPL
jgi:hypothetical protein